MLIIQDQHLEELVTRYERATFVVTRRINAKVREKLPDELTLDQLAILRYVKHTDQVTSSDLSDAFCVGKSTITSIITKLVDKGWLERIYSNKDRRIFYLQLTPSGQTYLSTVEIEVKAILAPYLGLFDQDEAFQFIKTLEKFAKVLQQ